MPMILSSHSKKVFVRLNRIRGIILMLAFIPWMTIIFFLPSAGRALEPGDVFQVGAAFLSHMAVHESGHYIMANMGGATDIQLNFFTMKGGNFYLGLSTARGLGHASSLPYKVAGEAASSYHFEVALQSYRTRATPYNRSLLFFSGTDLLWYSLYAFYLSSDRNPNYDPIGISQETGLSPEAIIGLAAFQTALNAYRVYSGDDRMIPYFALDKTFAEFGIQVRF